MDIGMDRTSILIEDLSRTIGDMYKGTATVTFYTNESNASIWEIRGHKKELVVMLHYQNGCEEANEIIDTEDTVFIKEEPRDVVNVCHQNESAQDMECMDDAKVVVHMSDSDNPTCQLTKDYSLQSITCNSTSSEEAVSVQSTTFNDVSNEEAVSHSYTYIKSSVDLVADENSLPDVPDSTSHLIKVYTLQSTTCNSASTEEAIPRLDMVCSSNENIRSELGYSRDFKCEIIDAKINYGQSCHSDCETVPENKNLCATAQIESISNSNDTNTSQTENENILVEMQSVKLKNCFVLLRPLEKNKLKNSNLSSVQDQHTFTSTSQEVTDEGNGSSVECSKCGRRFVIKDNLGSLNRIQTTDNNQLCSCCVMADSKFKLKYCMKKQKLICSEEKPFECPCCGKMLSSKRNLKQHQLIHTGVKPFECSWCNKKYLNTRSLKRHEDTHNGIKSYKCSLCNKEFNWKANLKRHMVIHSVVKPHECSQCNKTFYWKDQLKQHEVTHSGLKLFECSVCNKKFNWKARLKQHEATHSGVKPHECSLCNKTFYLKSQLKLHEAIHSGVKSHECSHCNKKFYLYRQLRRHKLIHFAVNQKEHSK